MKIIKTVVSSSRWALIVSGNATDKDEFLQWIVKNNIPFKVTKLVNDKYYFVYEIRSGDLESLSMFLLVWGN